MLKPLNTAQPSERQLALTALKPIIGIRVVTKEKTDGYSAYVIDIYYRAPQGTSHRAPQLPSPTSIPHSQLALHALTTSVDRHLHAEHFGNREPDHQTKKAFMEVFDLKDKLLAAAFGCRRAKRCRLCDEIFHYLIDVNKTPPAVLRAFNRTKGKKKMIEHLATAIVGIVVRAQILTATQETRCESDEKILIMVKEFLQL